MVGSRRTTLRVDPDVWDHPKTLALASALRTTPERAVRDLTKVWASVLRRRTGGLLLVIQDAVSAEAVQQEFGREVGIEYPGTFLSEMQRAGLLDQHGREFWVHDWSDWQGASRARAHAHNILSSPDSYSGTQLLPGLDSSTGDTGDSTDSSSGRDVLREKGRLEDRMGYGEGKKPFSARNGARKTTGEGPDSSAPFTRFMWWLVEGFGHRDYLNDGYDATYLTRYGKGVDMALVAECYLAIKTGPFGDQYDRRNLSARHAMKKIDAFNAFKARRKIRGTVVALTAAGEEHHPSARRGSNGVAGADAGAPPGSDRPADPVADDDRSWDVARYAKYLERTAERNEDPEGLAF